MADCFFADREQELETYLPEFCPESAELISVGTELLMGQILNRNAQYLAQELRDLGIPSFYQSVCGDNRERLAELLRLAMGRSRVLILTGGLGPTDDDLSLEVAAEVAGRSLHFVPEIYQQIEDYFRALGRSCSPNNRKQALVPDSGLLLPNHNGTAPGLIFADQDEEHVFILLPGPPPENRPIFADYVRPWLRGRSRFQTHTIFIRMIGIGESEAAAKVRDLLQESRNPSLAVYCSTGEIYFRISCFAATEEEARRASEPLLHVLEQRLGDYIYEIGQRPLVACVSDLLRQSGHSLALAESCTGGLIAKQLTDLPGSSEILMASLVTYSNAAKVELLDVEPQILETAGAVSEACVRAMAQGAKRRLGADYALAVSGVAGPGGGSPEKPVGTVYIGLAGPHDRVLVRHFRFRGDRAKQREQAALNALNLLRQELLGQLAESVGQRGGQPPGRTV